MNWREKTHGTRFELVRHFLATLFDSDMFSARGQWGNIAIGAFALVIPAGIILLSSAPQQIAASLAAAQATAQAERLSLITLLLSITAILALLAWQSLFPSRRDYLALAGLPVHSRQIFAARFVCMLLLAAALTAILILPALSPPHAIKLADGARWSSVSDMRARAASSGLGCLLVFFALVGLQGLLVNVLPAKWLARWSGYIQGFLLGVALLTGLYSYWLIPNWEPASVPHLLRAAQWAPPVWFLGLHEALSGGRDTILLSLGAQAIRLTVGSIGFAVLMYIAASVRYRRLLIEGGEGLAAERTREWLLLRWIAPNPRQEAILQFLGAVLTRSRVHRLLLMAYAGAGIAILVNSVLLGAPKRFPSFIALYWPLGLSVFALAAIRHAFVMPVEWKANWLFRLLESQGRRDWMNAVERFVLLCVIAPIHLASLPISIALLGPGVALRMTSLQVLVSLAVFEFLFYSWQQLPFTCSYVPGKTSLILQLGAWLAILILVIPRIALMVAALAQLPEVFAIYSVMFVAAWIWARLRRRDGWGDAPLVYEDTQGTPLDLGIRELSYGGVRAQMEAEEPVVPATGPAPASELSYGLRAYRAISRLFPGEFRENCGEQMDQTAADALHEVGPAHLLADASFRMCVEHVAQLSRDVRYAVRSLAGSPAFTAVALVSLGLGMCIASCAFSEMSGIVLRDLPGAARPDELVSIERRASYPLYRRYHDRMDLFSDSTAYVPAVPFGVVLNGHAERIWGHLVTPSYFSTFGVRPATGRFFDAHPNARSAVVSYRFWKEHLAADPGVVGDTLRINGQPISILGVASKDFIGAMPMTAADLFLPLPPDPAILPALAGNALENPGLAVLAVVGRLHPFVSRANAEAALDGVERHFEQDTGDPDRNRPGRRITLAEGGKCLPLRREDKPFFTSFFVIMAGLIMMIACANVANMTLARAASRRREIAVRLAVGAGRGRIVRQLLTESLLLACAAGLAGAIASLWIMRAAGQMRMPTPVPWNYSFLQPDYRVFLLAFALSLATGLALGLMPAFQAARADLTPALKEGGNVRVRRFRRLSLRNVLMVSQMAGSLTLLVILGFLAIGIQSTLGVQTGFNPANLYLISLDPTRDGYTAERSELFFPKLLDRVQALPSVAAASLSVTVPVAMVTSRVTFSTSESGATAARRLHRAISHTVGKDYFVTTGIPIVAGRPFRRQDETEDSDGVIVTEALVKDIWPEQDPLGHTLEISNGEAAMTVRILPSSYDYRPVAHTRENRSFEVVGVADNVAEGLVAGKPQPAIYFPLRPSDYAQPSQQGVTLIVRARPAVDAVALVRREISGIDSNVTPFYAGSMAQHVDEFMSPLRGATWTYGFMGFFGLILSAVGLAGMTAYAVARRNHEIGIRLALGAGSGSVLGLIMKEGARLIAVGTAIGMVGGWAASRGLAAMTTAVGQVASTSPSNPIVLYGAPLLLASVALLACYVPARKSLRVDLAVTLRQE